MSSEALGASSSDPMVWVGDIPGIWADRRPERLAIIVPEHGRQTTYAMLASDTQRFAHLMHELGLRSGSRVAYLGRNSDLFFIALLGCIAARLVLVPLNWRCAPPELAFMLEDSEASLVITDDEFLTAIDQAVLLAPALSALTRLPAEGSGSLREALARDGFTSHGRASYGPDEICLQLYTSGTTGRPKGVLITHRALSAARHAETVSPDWSDWNADDVILSPLPNFHIGGMSWMLIGLIRGLTCVLTSDASVSNILRLVDRYGVSRTFIVPTVLRAMLDTLRDTGQRPPRIRAITYGAASIGEALLREAIAVIGCSFAQYFGMTETTGTVTFLRPADHDLLRPHLLKSVGQPQIGMAVEIRDMNGNRVPAGVAGEIWLRTPALMAGYWRQPEATRAAIKDGWYRSGDGGKLDDDGYLYITDRIKDMIISGGENIYPAEVEEVLRRHPAVSEAAVVGIPDEQWGERVVAMVECQVPNAADAAGLIAFAQTFLARYKCPRSIVFVDKLPRTAMGKVQRALVRSTMRSGA